MWVLDVVGMMKHYTHSMVRASASYQNHAIMPR